MAFPIVPVVLGVAVVGALALSKRPTGRFIGDKAQIGDKVVFNLGQTTISPEVSALQNIIQGRSVVLNVTEMDNDTLTGYVEIQNGPRLFGPVTIPRSSVTMINRGDRNII